MVYKATFTGINKIVLTPKFEGRTYAVLFEAESKEAVTANIFNSYINVQDYSIVEFTGINCEISSHDAYNAVWLKTVDGRILQLTTNGLENFSGSYRTGILQLFDGSTIHITEVEHLYDYSGKEIMQFGLLPGRYRSIKSIVEVATVGTNICSLVRSYNDRYKGQFAADLKTYLYAGYNDSTGIQIRDAVLRSCLNNAVTPQDCPKFHVIKLQYLQSKDSQLSRFKLSSAKFQDSIICSCRSSIDCSIAAIETLQLAGFNVVGKGIGGNGYDYIITDTFKGLK